MSITSSLARTSFAAAVCYLPLWNLISRAQIELGVTAISRANLHDGGSASVSDTDRTDLLVENRGFSEGDGMVTPMRWSSSVVTDSQCEMGRLGLDGSRGSGATQAGRAGGTRCGGGSSSSSSSRNRRHFQLSRSLFIEIEDKASEPPLVRPTSGRYIKVHSRRGVSGGPGGKGAGATQDDSDGERFDGRVERKDGGSEAVADELYSTLCHHKMEQNGSRLNNTAE